MRSEFEKLPEVENSLSEHIWFGSDGLYHSALVNFQGLVGWLNGAWYAYQEQQKRIDAVLQLCKSKHQKVDYWVDHFIDDVEELLK